VCIQEKEMCERNQPNGKNQRKELNSFLKEPPANEKIKVDLDFLKN
jgi:hypothetical protein